MPSEQDEKTDAVALARVLNEVEQEYEMLLKEQPEVIKPQPQSPRSQPPNIFRRGRR